MATITAMAMTAMMSAYSTRPCPSSSVRNVRISTAFPPFHRGSTQRAPVRADGQVAKRYRHVRRHADRFDTVELEGSAQRATGSDRVMCVQGVTAFLIPFVLAEGGVVRADEHA